MLKMSRMFNKRIVDRAIGTLIVLSMSVASLGAQQRAARKPALSAEIKAALARISAASMQGHLSFIASDLLEGRNTPSPGLDLAASYIAAQMRRAGLEPAGDDGYFQTARWLLAERDMDNFEIKIQSGGETVSVTKDRVSLPTSGILDLANAPVFKLDYKQMGAVNSIPPELIAGRVIVTEIPDFRREEGPRRTELFQAQGRFLDRMHDLKAVLVVSFDRVSPTGSGAGQGRLIDPENRVAHFAASSPPFVTVHAPSAIKLYDAMPVGASQTTMTVKLPEFRERPIRLRNVAGLLRGSDAALKDTCVLVTAHYDHIGARPSPTGDGIYNGANDDGSGTVAVMEIAAALATMKQRPRRSMLFVLFFGEEKGMLGSRYYGRHPIFPIEKTVADINLEQVGRTDSDEGPQVGTASLTGFDYSDVGAMMKEAGSLTGVRVYKHERNSDAYFGRSDNQALADQGVPAHTLCVAFSYPDYHGAGDHWEKIDYANMEKVARMVALAAVMVANNPQEPKWNEANPKAARYLKAWQQRRNP
ncbi:MAG TPA: M28 family peptidase [Blastocatellia bacterium]|nr:M28 family peptidase [Blastocatellia bacterium]